MTMTVNAVIMTDAGKGAAIKKTGSADKPVFFFA